MLRPHGEITKNDCGVLKKVTVGMESIQKDVYDAVLSGEVERIKELFGEVNATEEQEELQLFSYKDEAGRNALMTASILGRSDIVRELVKNGAQLDESTVRGEAESFRKRFKPSSYNTSCLCILVIHNLAFGFVLFKTNKKTNKNNILILSNC